MSNNSNNSFLKKVAVIVPLVVSIQAFIENVIKYDIPHITLINTVILSAFISILLLLFTYFKWQYSESKEGFIFLKKNYLFGLIVFNLIIFLVLGYHYSLIYVTSNDVNHKERIVVLIPLDKNKSHEPAYQDGKRQAYGYIDLIEKNPGILSNYEIVFRNHQMDTDVAIKIVIDELKRGTNYFIATMSHISEKLSMDFEKLVEEHKLENKDIAKLIATVSSSSKINVKRNRIYRFYIRSNEESKLLASYYASLKSDSRLISITVNDNYGNRAKEIFNDTYSKPFDINIPLEIKWDKAKIKERILNKVSLNNENNTFFIVHYGSGLDNIISILDELNLKGLLLISHTITVEEWKQPINDILSNYDWVTCYPESPSGNYYNSKDVIRDFVYFTLHRLIKSINTSNINGKDFDKAWKESNEPNRIKYKINAEGGSEIKLKIKTNKKK